MVDYLDGKFVLSRGQKLSRRLPEPEGPKSEISSFVQGLRLPMKKNIGCVCH